MSRDYPYQTFCCCETDGCNDGALGVTEGVTTTTPNPNSLKCYQGTWNSSQSVAEVESPTECPLPSHSCVNATYPDWSMTSYQCATTDCNGVWSPMVSGN